MQSFNPELKVGMQAMVINVHHPENTHLIGKLVMVEALLSVGESVQEWYDSAYTVLPLKFNMAIVTGVGTGKHHKDGYATFKQIYLMPLPPLDDDAIIEATQTKETAKC